MDLRLRILTLAVGTVGACAALPAAAPGAAVTYQGDAAHTGNVDAPFRPPLGKKWVRRDLGSRVSYPVIGDGKVFVTALGRGNEFTLFALDRRTGGTVWSRPVGGSELAYDKGQVFVGNGKLQAYSANDGHSLWLLEPTSTATTPVVDGTSVFVSTQVDVSAYEELTGAPVATSTGDGSQSGVALDGPRVYTARGCEVAMFTKGLGQPAWTFPTECGSGAYPPAIFGGRVWAHSATGAGVVLDQNLGLKTDGFESRGGPAFNGNLAYFRGKSQIQARRIDTGTFAWTFAGDGAQTDSSGDAFAGSLLFVRGVVYGLTAGNTLFGLDAATGARLWSTSLGGDLGFDPYYSGSAYDTTGRRAMAADASGLVVPAGNRLAALGPGPDTPAVDDPDKHPGAATKLTVSASAKSIDYGKLVHIGGELTRNGESNPRDRLELQAATYPYDVWRTVARGTPDDTPRYGFSVRPDRNTRYRVVDIDTAPAVVSREMRVVVFLRTGARFYTAGRSRIRVSVYLIAPPFLEVTKHPLYVYRARSRRSRPKRVGRLRVRQTRRAHYRSRGVVKVPRLRRRDLFYWCVPIRAWHEIGRFKHRDTCGRKRL